MYKIRWENLVGVPVINHNVLSFFCCCCCCLFGWGFLCLFVLYKRISWRNSQYWRQDNYKHTSCLRHWRPSWTRARAGQVAKSPWRGFHTIWHADQCREDPVDDINGISTDITIENKKLETVRSFKYLGAIVSVEGSKSEVLSRIAQITATVTKLKGIWNDKDIVISSKIRLMRSVAMSIFVYACKTWTITADIKRRIHALEMRCFRKLLGISYKDHKTNEEVEARTGNAIGPNEEDLTSVKRRKLKWYGHVTRSSVLAKTILQGTIQGGRQRGRQRKRWDNNIKEWTGLEWNIILRKSENRVEWRKLVVKFTVVPQRSAWLRDR